MRNACLLIVLLAPVACLRAGAEKPSSAMPVTVRMHAEGKESDSPTFVAPVEMTNPRRRVFIRQAPIITERDFVAMYPFNSADGSIGSYFKLDASGTNRLEQHTTEARDTMVVILINGRVSCAMMVDKKIKDGLFYVPSGFAPVEITQLQTKLKVIGKEKEFDLQKKNAQSLLADMNKKAAKIEKDAKAAKKGKVVD